MGNIAVGQLVSARLKRGWARSRLGRLGLGIGLIIAALGLCYGFGVFLGWSVGKLINL